MAGKLQALSNIVSIADKPETQFSPATGSNSVSKGLMLRWEAS